MSKKKKEKKVKSSKEKKPKSKKVKKAKKEEAKVYEISLKLKVAKQKDLLEIDKYLEGGKKKWKMRSGIPFWLINSKGEIENKNYILDEESDKNDISDWLVRGQLLIPIRQ